MKLFFALAGFFISLHTFAQDSTMNSLTKDMDKQSKAADHKMPVKIFNSDRAINANTTEVIGKGKMDFKVTHNFGDLAGGYGGIKNFFGLDFSTDIRIGFHVGLTDRLNLNIAHIKGDEYPLRDNSIPFRLASSRTNLVRKLYEVALKYQLLRQLENDPSHPVSVTLFVNTVISTMKADTIPSPDNPKNFKGFGDRMSQTFQAIIARKIGKASIQLNPTLVHYNYVPSYDDATTFALGGAARIPISRNFAIIVDYFHPFHSDAKKNNYENGVFKGIKFHDALGVGLEITTAGHIFHMNFTNTSGILENEFIPYNSNSWGKGQFRWGFTISRAFVLWRQKSK